jgi:hypothetical protein
MNNPTTNILNQDIYKDRSKSQQESIRKIFFTCLKELPREIILKALKDKGFVERDWEGKGNKHKLKQL